MTDKGRISAPRERGARRDSLPRYDQKLRAAKNIGSEVRFTMATDAYFTDEDGVVTGQIDEVDKFDVAIKLSGTLGRRIVWLKKSQIMATEIL